jgi:hypothetical protein
MKTLIRVQQFEAAIPVTSLTTDDSEEDVFFDPIL